MACLANVELKQLDQLLKEMNRENTNRSSNLAWNVLFSFSYPCGLVKKYLTFHKTARLTLAKSN